MQAMVSLTCAFADNKGADIRLEAAAAKYFCSEYVWKCLDDYVQIRGGRGYENPLSLYERGEKPTSAEIALRDMRIGRIFEGSSEVMHPIMARETPIPICLHAHHQTQAGPRRQDRADHESAEVLHEMVSEHLHARFQ